MIYAIIAIAVVVTLLIGYVIDRFAKIWTNVEALNSYAIASFERLVRLEAIVDDLFELEDQEEQNNANET